MAEIDGRGVALTTEHDAGITNMVVLTPAAWEALRMFMAVRTLAKKAGGPAACWPWLRKTDSQGRARYRFEGRMRDVHQISFYLQHGLWLKRYDIPSVKSLGPVAIPAT